MKILNITPINTTKTHRIAISTNKQQNNNTVESENKLSNKTFSYMDFNISFSGRTPENFYQQDFNRENMPDTMKEYLNYDYETRQHIPPEQMMSEVFKYIDLADNFEEVKDIYPNEKLFNSLHENYQNNRTSILGEIKLAKELSDQPLFKDGSDNFGMYLLKKIYLNGKTVKEISKDFYEKDMNDAYKGIITKPIDSQTTSAYGIRYPKNAFWHSFIATREEYKKFFVTLPKNSINPAINLKTINNKNTPINTPDKSEKTEPYKPKPRKFQIKSYQKKQLTDDIKDAKGQASEIEKKIRKRFAKDDPEASFIVKYLSPIMAVAADRVHLSEEMKNFAEIERKNGKIGNDEYMFGRFWKKNPHILNYYAQTITDTIDLFEEVYGEGGLIQINKDLEVIKPETENKRAVDKVSPEFIELLNYTQTIAPEREKRYALHDQMQNSWNEHFITKYGIPDDIETEKGISTINEITKPELADNKIDIQKLFIDSIKNETKIYPSSYAAKHLNYMLNNKDIDDDYKLAYAHYIGGADIDNIKLSEEEFYDKFNNIEGLFAFDYMQDDIAAKIAIIETLARNNYRDYRLYTMNTYDFPHIDQSKDIIIPAILKDKQMLNQLYSEYKKPLKPQEINKTVDELFKQLTRYRTQNEITEQNLNIILLMLQDACKTPPRADFMKQLLKYAVTKDLTFAKSILNQDDSAAEKVAKFENVMLLLFTNLLNSGDTLLVQIIGEENLQKYFNQLKNDDVKLSLISKINKLMPQERNFFTFKNSQYLKDYEKDPEACRKKYEVKLG